ncbi:class I mannose-6-phosphate isomerase [Sphingorhabdus arenilitoris]|uniref:Class I mannose-6-phosphate isomerase n=1 Tax=Sphingorhabdus arenilitoris TaxID=1490041 RepID=A0ABV8RHG6_9SPHN
MKLAKQMVAKPWGRCDIPGSFAVPAGQRIGEIWYEAPEGGNSPLLVKWLFTSEKLSVQVHPNDAQAKARGYLSGKEECWYIVSAQPGSLLGIGLRQAISKDDLRAAALSGGIEALIDWRPVHAGEYYYIPAGTIHAIGPGITLVEVQQHADITYRLYDYGRLDNGHLRTLHLDDALAVATLLPYSDSRSGKAKTGAMLTDGPFFRLLLADAGSRDKISGLTGSKWIVPVAGAVSIDEEIVDVGECLLASEDAVIDLTDDGLALIAAAVLR